MDCRNVSSFLPPSHKKKGEKKARKKKARVFTRSWRVLIVQGYREPRMVLTSQKTHCAGDKKSPFFYNNF